MRAFSMTGPGRGALRVPPARARGPARDQARVAGEGGIEEVMHAGVVCVLASEGIPALRLLLVERQVGGVPVVRADGRPVGIVSGGDLLRALLRGGTPPTTAGDVMADVLALPITASVAQAAALMSYEGRGLIVITDLAGQVAGVVQALDIARWNAREAGYLVDRAGSGGGEDGGGDLAA
jgi:CBS domain-containing protein